MGSKLSPTAVESLDKCLEDIGVTTHTASLLARSINVITVRDVLLQTEAQLASIDKMGEAKIREVKQCLCNHGFVIPGMKPEHTEEIESSQILAEQPELQYYESRPL